jgi:MFS family permease
MTRPHWQHRLHAAWRTLPPSVHGLMLGECLGLLAAAAMQLSLAWWISQQAGAAALVRYGSLTALAGLIATPVLSPAGDRWPKRRLIRLGKLGLAVDALVLVGLQRWGVFDLNLLTACSLVSVAATALLWPVEASILPELVDAAALPTAIRLRRDAQAIGGLLGPALGGAALGSAGIGAALGLNLALFLLAAGAAWWVGVVPAAAAPTPQRAWLTEMAQGLRALWRVRVDRWWTLVGALMLLCLLPATGLLLPLRLQALGLSAGWFGTCNAALSVGLLGGIAGAAPALIRRLGRIRALAVAITVCAAALAAIGWCHPPLAIAACLATIGLCLSVTQLVGQTHRLLATPAAYRSRLSAAHLAIAQLAAALAPAGAGLLLQKAPVDAVYPLLAIGFATGGLLLWAVPGLGDFLRQDHDAVRGWYARRYPHAFTAR